MCSLFCFPGIGGACLSHRAGKEDLMKLNFLVKCPVHLKRGTLLRKFWFSRVPLTKLQIYCGENKVVENLNAKVTFRNKIATFNTERK